MTAGLRPKKDRGIESLRGIAIFLLVAGHAIGAHDFQGLEVSDDSGWRFFYRALEDLRMPLFTVLSGYVYAYRPVRAPDGMSALVKGKLRRLLVPFVVVTTVFFLVQMVVPGTNTTPSIDQLPREYLFGYQHLWFLQAIFLIFLVVGLLDAHRRLATFGSWAGVTAASLAVFVLLRLPDSADVFSINGALRLLPFFLLGYGAHRYGPELLRPRILAVATVAFVPVYAVRLWTISVDADWHPMLGRALSLAVAVLVVVTLLAVRRHLESRALIWLGGFSFGIYLLHVFGTAGARIVATRLGVDSTPLLFVISLTAGIGLPILFELIFGRFKVISWGVLGQTPRRRASAVEPATGQPKTASVDGSVANR